MNAIYILWLRQLKRFIRKRASIVGALGQPLIFLIAFGFGLGPIFRQAGAGDYIQFVGPGIIAMMALFTSVFTGMEVIWDKQMGFMKETFVAPISRLEILLGKMLGVATVALIQGVMVFLITLLLGFQFQSWTLLPLALLYLLLISCFFSAAGLAMAIRLDDMQSFPIIMNFVIQPLFYLSSALFPLVGLPKWLEIITKLNPLSYGVDGMRYALGSPHLFSPALSLGVLVVCTVVALAVGIYQFSKVEL